MKKLYSFFVLVSLITLVSCSNESEYITLAQEAETWIASTAIIKDEGMYWPAQPDTTVSGSISLYHGVPGVLLFYNDLYKATGNEKYRESIVKGTQWLISEANEKDGGYYWSNIAMGDTKFPDPGLYTGTAGVGTTLLELYASLQNEEYLTYARGAADYLVNAAVRRDAAEGDIGVSWNNANDIVSGAAGTGMFLIQIAGVTGDSKYLETAKKAGEYLIDQAITNESGSKWEAFVDWETLYPNFSHGTSGIAYYLALLHEETGDKRFLDVALKGVDWLINNKAEGVKGAAWYHHEVDGEDLYYVSWCHGPPGTARLFYQLYLNTRDEKWMQLVRDSAEWLMEQEIHAGNHDGYWNVSQCCGTAGIGDFFANMYMVTGEKKYFDWASRMTDVLKQQSTSGADGKKWVQAENRRDPETKFAQTGYAQGAAGIGLFFLKMYSIENDNLNYKALVLPDSPFEK